MRLRHAKIKVERLINFKPLVIVNGRIYETIEELQKGFSEFLMDSRTFNKAVASLIKQQEKLGIKNGDNVK